MFGLIVPAAGQSRRFGDQNRKKIVHKIAGEAIWIRAIRPFRTRQDLGQILLAVAKEDRPQFESEYADVLQSLNISLVIGGAERVDTVSKCLDQLKGDVEYVAVHDAARPFPSPALIDAVFEAAKRDGAAIPGIPIADTIKKTDDDGWILETVPRAGLMAVQTPQAFRVDLLRNAHANRPNLKTTITDDAQLVEALGHRCRVVLGSPFNLKITTQSDLRIAASIDQIIRSSST